MQSSELLRYIQQGIDVLIASGQFNGGQEFRATQSQALEAYQLYLNRDDLTTEEKLKGFFEIPTGVGKTAVFVGIVAAAHAVAKADGKEIKTAVVVPTRQLLKQTVTAFKTFSPELSKVIGLYGDGHKNLSMPITVITYNAWNDLSETGVIGSHNIDILISDEAHRGTSDRRVGAIGGAYTSETLQLAFTATAHFDESKSVEGSHERQIFYKSPSDAIREGELASYIRSQRAVIRVEPTEYMLSDEFNEASEDAQMRYRRKLRQTTWNKFAVKAYRDGKDEHTGDPLTDNQAGFFVDSIWQANDLEKALNRNMELQLRAEERGCKGVAVAIHSKLSTKEQERRFEAYMNGEYMAVIGDDKFKEGFDHPPMKTIIDCPHSSVVDKAQIIGRGARKWWNELKQRFEGLTVIDTAIYIGSPDKDENELNRERALRNSISVKEVLEESYVLGPEAPKAKLSSKGHSGGGRSTDNIFIDDDNIEYYSTVEHVHILQVQISRYRKEHWVEITEEMYAFLRHEVERTGVGSKNLLLNAVHDRPPDLSSERLNNIIGGMQKSVPQDNWEWIVNEYSRLETKKRNLLTVDMVKELNDEMDRTNTGAISLLQKFQPPYDSINGPRIQTWKDGKVQSVLESDWDWVLQSYKSLPTVSAEIVIDAIKMAELVAEVSRTNARGSLVLTALGQDAPVGLSSTTINKMIDGKKSKIRQDFWAATLNGYRKLPTTKLISAVDISHLQSEKERTGKGFHALLSSAPDKPDGLSSQMCEKWMQGKVKRAQPEHYAYVIEAYKKLPDTKPVKSIPVTQEMIDTVVSEAYRTNIKATKLLSLHPHEDAFTSNQINDMQRGKLSSVNEKSWEWIIASYKKEKDVHYISESDKTFLQAEIDRTKIGPKKILSYAKKRIPNNLTPHSITNWSKKTKSALKEHWDFVIEIYKDLPDRNIRPRRENRPRP